MIAVRVVDETTSGDREVAGEIEFASPVITLRDLIAARVRQELENRRIESACRKIAPDERSETERLLNDSPKVAPPGDDLEKRLQQAFRSFESNGYLVLTKDRQLTDLDEFLDVAELGEIRFLKLVPLIGG